MKRIALSILIVFSAQLSFAGSSTIPTSTVKADFPGFDQLEEAIKGIMPYAFALSEEVNEEHAGCVFELAGKYYYSEPVSQGSYDDFQIKCLPPKGARLQAIYHTHPAGSDVGFSTSDIRIAKELKVNNYVACGDSGKILRFRPDKTRVRYERGRRDSMTSKGEVIGDIE